MDCRRLRTLLAFALSLFFGVSGVLVGVPATPGSPGNAAAAPPLPARLYVGIAVGGSWVQIVDPATNTVLKTVKISANIGDAIDLALTPDGSRLYTANATGGTVSVLDTATDTVVATISLPFARGLAVSPDGAQVYVVGGPVTVIDTATNTVVGSPISVGTNPVAVAFNPAGTRAYVANGGSASVSVIDTASRTVIATVPTGLSPLALTVSADGSRVYVAHNGARTVAEIDTATNTVVATVPVGGPPPGGPALGVAVNPAGTRVYAAVSPTSGGTLKVIDTASHAIVADVSLSVPGQPAKQAREVVLNPAGTLAYVANNHADGTISVVDTASNTLVATIPLSGAAVPLAYRAGGADPVVDETPPTTQAAASPQPNAAGWSKADFTATLSATDDLSGVASTEYVIDSGAWTAYAAPIVISVEGSHTVRYRSTDRAGNVEPEKSLTVKIDKTRPTIGSTCSPGAPDGQWHAADVSFACTASDPEPGSGLANAGDAGFSLTTTVPSGTETATTVTNSHDVCDKAENCVTVGPVGGNKVDKKVPEISITVPANNAAYTVGQVVKAAYTCSDGGSGPATCTGPVPDGSTIDTASPGAKSLTVNATDTAGNATSQTVTYAVAYNFGGFFQPVDNLPTVNSMQAGRAVPVKFSLGGNFGLNVVETGYPRSEAIPCDSTALVNGVEETNTAGASSLTYDAGSGHYHYVWKTEQAWDGTCRQLVIKLTDGTFHRANFRFK